MAIKINNTNIIDDSRIITNAAVVLVGSATSTGTANQRLQVQGGASFVGVNSSIGIGTTNPGEKLQVDGNIRLGISTSSNYLAFYGTTGDGAGSYNHTFVGERLWGVGAGNEQSELLLFKGNDAGSGVGPDRIRLAAGEIRFDTYITATSGTFDAVGSSANLITRAVLQNTGEFLVGTATSTGTPTQALQVNSGGYFNGLVGIGLTRPTSRLHVFGDTLVNGIVTATSFFGSGANLTSLTGATAGTYGNSLNTPQIVVDANGRITSITQVAVTGAGGTGTAGINVLDNNASLGLTTFLDFRNSLSVTSLGSTLAIDVIPQWTITAAGIHTLANVGIGTTNPTQKLEVLGSIRADRYRGINSLVLNTYQTVNPSSNVYLYSPPNDRDAWIYLDSADTASNWGIYHRQIDSAVTNLPANSIGFIGGGTNTLQSYISLNNGDGYFRGNLLVGSISSTGTASQQLQVNSGAYISGDLGLGVTNPTATLQIPNTQSQSLTDSAIWLNGGSGALMFDDTANKRISWNDSGGNFNIRLGHYHNGIGISYTKSINDTNSGASCINLGGDGGEGTISLTTAPIGVPNAPVTFTNYIIMYPAWTYIQGPLAVGLGTVTGAPTNNRFEVGGGSYFSGNMGIGITNPQIPLQIQNSNSTYSNPQSANVPVVHCYNANTVSGTAHAILGARVGGANGGDPFISFDVNGVGGWSLGLDNSDNDAFKISRSWSDLGNTNYFILDTSGDVGIGTTNPTFKLHVQGTGSFQTSVNTDSTTFGVFDTTATTVNGFGSATTMSLGFDGPSASSTTNINTGATASGFVKTINIGTGSAGAGSTVNINIGSGPGAGSTSTITIGSGSGLSRTIINSLTSNIANTVVVASGSDEGLRGPIVSFATTAVNVGDGYRDGVNIFTISGGTGTLSLIKCSVGGGVIRSVVSTPDKEGRSYTTNDQITVGIPTTTIPSTAVVGDGTYATASFSPQVQLATTAAAGVSSVATLTFATQPLAPYPPNSTITVSGVTPTGYNGTYQVLTCTTTQVSYSCTATGSQSVAGTISLHPFVLNGQVSVSGVTPVGLGTTNGLIVASTATNVTYSCSTAGSATVQGTIQQGTPVTSGIVTVTGVRRAGVQVITSSYPRLRLENTTSSVSAGTELGSVLFGCRDANTGGSGDKGRIVAVAEGTSGGATVQVWTSSNANEPTICAAFGGDNDFRLYDATGIFYHTFSNTPTANRVITVPDYSFIVASQNVAETITGIKTFTARPNFATGIAVTSIVSTVPGIALSTTNAPGIVGFTTNAIGIAITANIASNYAAIIDNDGNATTRFGMRVLCGADDGSGSNTAIAFDSGNGTNQGSISFTSGTVTYGAFTANHDCIIPSYSEQIPYGSLMIIKNILYKKDVNGEDMERGILYEAGISTLAYARNLLGAYSGEYDANSPVQQVNNQSVHQVLVLGDGHIRCCGENGNINIGDGITSSSMEGVGMKMNKIGVVIGLAQEDVVFDDPSDVKLVPVQYGLHQYIPDNISDYIETLMSS